MQHIHLPDFGMEKKKDIVSPKWVQISGPVEQVMYSRSYRQYNNLQGSNTAALDTAME